MQEKDKIIYESLEKIKEVDRLQYDYFKHFTTLNTASILIIVAFIEKIFNYPDYIIIAFISIASLAISLIGSLWVMAVPINIILYKIGSRIEMELGQRDEETLKKIKELENKVDKSYGIIKRYDFITKISFLIGIISFLIFCTLNFINDYM